MHSLVKYLDELKMAKNSNKDKHYIKQIECETTLKLKLQVIIIYNYKNITQKTLN